MSQKDTRMTTQRKVILELLEKQKSHPTADEIYNLVRERLPRISLGTVYRNLDLLSESGYIKKIESPGSPMRFDALKTDHYHIRCVKCGKLDDVMSIPEMNFEEKIRDESSFKVLGFNLEFLGICPDCRN